MWSNKSVLTHTDVTILVLHFSTQAVIFTRVWKAVTAQSWKIYKQLQKASLCWQNCACILIEETFTQPECCVTPSCALSSFITIRFIIISRRADACEMLGIFYEWTQGWYFQKNMICALKICKYNTIMCFKTNRNKNKLFLSLNGKNAKKQQKQH